MFSNKILMVQKMVMSSSQGQGNFRGFEARDFKMCFRGQGRPRVLHLWPVHTVAKLSISYYQALPLRYLVAYF